MRIVLALIAVTAVFACNKQPAADAKAPDAKVEARVEAKAEAAAEAEATPTAADGEHVHGVACNCQFGQACGNMIEVEGQYVPLEGDLGLGKMAFCGKKDLRAEVEGEMKDGKFVATSLKMIN